MPEKQTIERAKAAKLKGKSPSTQAGEFVREEIHHIREGKHGARSTKQAIAIGLSKARRAGVDLAAPEKGTVSEKTRRSAQRAQQAGQTGKTSEVSAPGESDGTRAQAGEQSGRIQKIAVAAGAVRGSKAPAREPLGGSAPGCAHQGISRPFHCRAQSRTDARSARMTAPAAAKECCSPAVLSLQIALGFFRCLGELV